ncbi:MAG: formylglycine-generating enzyme family protein, partial [Polyangiales bacterium]
TCAVAKDCMSGHCVDLKCAPCPAKTTAVKSGTTKFCVDVDEVTNADYKAFLATSPSTTGQPSVCSWNNSYVPGSGSLPVWPVSVKLDSNPVRYVDWCDAYAYCKYAGKRLCGKIGGGTVGYVSDFANAGISEWMSACSAGGANTYTYAGSFDATKCNSKGSGYSTTVAAGSLSLCKNAYGNFDMSGNVSEWEDDCQSSSGATDLCHPRGGSYGSLDPRCSVNESFARSSQTAYTGIRCCSD